MNPSQVAVITGAGGGIARATAARLRSQGYHLVLGHRPGNPPALAHENQSARTVSGAGGVVSVETDVTDPQSNRDLVDAALQRHGRVDVLVTLAGVMEQAPFGELDPQVWRRTLEVNLTGTFLTCQAAAPALTVSRGAIVTIASQIAYTGGAGCAAYVASKAGVLGLTRAMARELGPAVRVNCVAPGPVHTALTAPFATPEWVRGKTGSLVMGRFGTPEEVAGAIAWLAGADAGYVTGQTLGVNGGGAMP